jgi:hypothetical protein
VDIKKNKPIAHLFLENCIKRLNTVGMPKREWKHILITTNPALFWTIFVALLGFAFWFGQVTANKSDKAAQEQPTNKNDSSVHKNVYLKDTTITDSTKQ